MGTEEATTGFEPVIAVLQTAALPLGYVADGGIRNCNRSRRVAGLGAWPPGERDVYSSRPCPIALLATG